MGLYSTDWNFSKIQYHFFDSNDDYCNLNFRYFFGVSSSSSFIDQNVQNIYNNIEHLKVFSYFCGERATVNLLENAGNDPKYAETQD